MKILRNLVSYTILATTAVVSTSSLAATDGTLGPTSTGTVDVQLTIGAQVQISDLNDIVLTATDLTVPAADYTSVCVYSNQGLTGNYAITATSTNGGPDFLATNGAESIPYTATWAQNGTNLLPTTFPTSGAKLTGQTGASTLSTSCLDILGGGALVPTAAFGVSFAAADLQQVPGGIYNDTVTLLVEPN